MNDGFTENLVHEDCMNVLNSRTHCLRLQSLNHDLSSNGGIQRQLGLTHTHNRRRVLLDYLDFGAGNNAKYCQIAVSRGSSRPETQHASSLTPAQIPHRENVFRQLRRHLTSATQEPSQPGDYGWLFSKLVLAAGTLHQLAHATQGAPVATQRVLFSEFESAERAGQIFDSHLPM